MKSLLSYIDVSRFAKEGYLLHAPIGLINDLLETVIERSMEFMKRKIKMSKSDAYASLKNLTDDKFPTAESAVVTTAVVYAEPVAEATTAEAGAPSQLLSRTQQNLYA